MTHTGHGYPKFYTATWNHTACFSSSSFNPPSKLTDVDDFLMSQDRSAHLILPDGNCLFRALSHQLYGCEKYHVELRNILLHVLQGNFTTYKSFWIEDTPQGKVTFQEHLKNLTKLGSWGTQVEIQAASDCYMAIFVCSSNPSGIILLLFLSCLQIWRVVLIRTGIQTQELSTSGF